MKQKKTSKLLKEEANKMDREVAALDEHYAKSVMGGSVSDADLEVQRVSRNKLSAQANLKRKQAEERD